MSRLVALILGIFLCVASWSPSAAENNIKLGMAAFNSSFIDHMVAIQKGFYADEGLKIEIIRGGGGVLTPALISGDLAFSASASSAMTAILKGADLRVIYTNLSKPTYRLWSNDPKIKTLRDLMGKRVGVNSRGDTAYLSMLFLMRKHGLDPGQIKFVPLKRSKNRVAAFKSGAVDATFLTPVDEARIDQTKGHRIAVVADEIQLVWTGVATSTKMLKENSDLVRSFLRGAVRGREFTKTHKEETLDILAKYIKATRATREAMTLDYNSVLEAMTADGTVSQEIRDQEIAARAELLKLANPPKSSNVFDYSITESIYSKR